MRIRITINTVKLKYKIKYKKERRIGCSGHLDKLAQFF